MFFAGGQTLAEPARTVEPGPQTGETTGAKARAAAGRRGEYGGCPAGGAAFAGCPNTFDAGAFVP
jgi:hypothetical protein